MPDPQEALLRMLGAGFLVALLAGLPAIFLYRRWRGERLAPDFVEDPPPWNGYVVFAAFLFSLLLTQTIPLVLLQSGILSRLYGPDFPQRMTRELLKDPGLKQDFHLVVLWGQTIALPVASLLMIGFVRFLPSERNGLFGPPGARAGRAWLLGSWTWLLATPAVFAIFFAALAILQQQADTHPLTDLGPRAGQLEWLLFAIQVIIFAPLNEEILFRGLLLRWCASTDAAANRGEMELAPRYRPHLIYVLAMFFPFLTDTEHDSVLPETFFWLAILVPVFLIAPRSRYLRRVVGIPSVQAVRAAFASAALFAAFHSSIWPSPIPLFFLAIALAWESLRSRSILPSIITHGLFNAVAVAYILLEKVG